VSENQRENDFERESSRLNDGLKSCRAVVDNYRAMIAGEQPHAANDDSAMSDNDDSAMSDYVSTTEEGSDVYESDSATN
jgi:hypothetical protein